MYSVYKVVIDDIEPVIFILISNNYVCRMS